MINKEYLILKNNNNKYGLFNTTNPSFTISSDYDFMGINDYYINKDINDSRFVVLKDNNWFIIDKEGNKISEDNSLPIYDYDDKYIYYVIITNGISNTYYIYDYKGNRVLSTYNIALVDYNEEYIIIKSNQNSIYIFNKDLELNKSYNSFNSNYSYKIEYNKIIIYNNNEIIDTF